MIFSESQKRHPFMSSSWHASAQAAWKNYVPRSRKVFGCICISPQDRILLVRGRQSGKWSLPKGHLEPHENDIQCALRELYEETGIVPDVKYSYYKKLAAGGYFIFFMNDEPHPNIQHSDEISEADWFLLQDVKRLSCNLDLNTFSRWMKKVNIRCATEVDRTDELLNHVCVVSM